MDMEDLRSWLMQRVAAKRGASPDSIDVHAPFSRHGLDSMDMTRIVADLGRKLGRPLAPTLAWEYPTLESLLGYLAGDRGKEPVAPRLAARSGMAAKEPMAIVGMACRFPRAPDLASFFGMLCSGVDAISEVPRDRWDVDALYDKDVSAPGKMSTKWAGFLDQVDQFDPQFFGISPREAMMMDPQQRLVLELAWEALESAGIPPRSLEESRTGVFMGAMWHDYADIPDDRRAAMTQHSATGQDLSIIPARVSYTLGLRGPSIAFNTACSSSLVAVHHARRSLELGECDLALAGGVNLLLSPESTVAMSKFGAMAPDGRSKAFDARANGYVRGEGGGVVVMKPLSRAIADGDSIHCILLGSAMNNDGASNGLTAPSPKAQELVLRDAYADAGIDARDVHFVETHGTGTMLGDPIEAGAIGAVLGAGRSPDRPLRLGAVKTNIGHLEAAAGIAGLVKTALSLRNGVVPPNLHFQSPNPHIDLEALRLAVPTTVEPWPEHGGRRLAGVSGFGFGGTNCHVVLEGGMTTAQKLGRVRPRGAPVFVFGGQGSQWLRMGMDLLVEPAFRAAIERCDVAMRPHMEGSLLDVLLSQDAGWLEETPKVQPAIFAVQVALASLVRSLGVEPCAVVGQSMGEVAAAHVAGCLDLDDAARVICVRSKLVTRASGKGAMAVVELPMVAAKRALEGRGDSVSIAVSSSPSATVLSGDEAALEALVTELEREGVTCRRIKVDYASHSREMDSLLPSLAEALEGLSPRSGAIPFYSTVTGDRIDGAALDAAYWCRNLREPVLFAETTSLLLRHGHEAFLDLDPHPLLVRPIEQCFAELGLSGLTLPIMRRDERSHAVLSESLAALGPREPEELRDRARSQILPLSAHTASALRDHARRMGEHIRKTPEIELSDIAFTASVRRSHLTHRLAIVGNSREQIAETLEAFGRGEEPTAIAHGTSPLSAPKVVFVFPGQGSQWVGMGRQLLAEEPVFRETIEACDAALRPECGLSVVDELRAEEARSRLAEGSVVQPVLFAIEVALAALWRSWGVVPDAVVGHSMGEVAAAYVAGALSLEDAAAVIGRRSRLMGTMSGKGAVALVELALPDAERALVGYETRLSVAGSNGPRSTVIAGEPGALAEVLARFEEKEVFFRRVKMDVASHSPQMEPLRGELVAALAGLSPRKSSIAMRSTVTGAPISGDELNADYWAENLRKPVLFSQATRELIREGYTVFLEMSPHPILVPSVEENLRESGTKGVALASLYRQADERQSLLQSLGRLFVHGRAIDWRRTHPEGGRVVELPTYPWQRERFWIESDRAPATHTRRRTGNGKGRFEHPLLGSRLLVSSAQNDEHWWEQTLGVQITPYLRDHRVQAAVVFPGAGYLEMALAAGREKLGAAKLVLEDVTFEQMLVLGDDDSERIAQVVLTDTGAGRCSFRIASREPEDSHFTRHVRGVMRIDSGSPDSARQVEKPESLGQRLSSRLSAAEHYEQMSARRLEYGPAFQALVELRTEEGQALGRVELPDIVDDHGYILHPSLLDACLQSAMSFLATTADVVTYVPVGIARLTVHARPSRKAWVVVTKVAGHCDLWIVDENGRALVEIEGLRAQPLEAASSSTKDPLEGCVHEIAWRHVEPQPPARLPEGGAWLLLMDRSGVGASLEAELGAAGRSCVRVFPGSSYARIEPDLYTFDPANADDYRRLLRDAFGAERVCLGAVHLASLDAASPDATTLETLSAGLARGSVSAMYLAQALLRNGFRSPPRLFLVTRGAQAVRAGEPVSVGQAPLIGLARTLVLEHPELPCTSIDLATTASERDGELLRRELMAKGGGDQVAWRDEERYVAELVRGTFEPGEHASLGARKVSAQNKPFQLRIQSPGVLERLSLHEARALVPGPGEVLVEVEAAGLNFRDVLLAMGVLPDDAAGADGQGPRLGLECAGRVVAVGEGVTRWSVGQEVLGFGARTFSSHVLARSEHIVAKSTRFSWAEAATLPAVFTTAHYALVRIGRLRRGERVLIHAGAGGVGLAAIQLAKHVGAEVFATAGSEEKRAYLRSIGVAHVFDSRSLAFVDEIKQITRGEGVDVVLNSLSGEFIPASLSLLRDYGRFVEIGKRDYYEDKPLGLRPFLRSLSFSLVDLLALLAQQPEEIGALLQELMEMFEAHALAPLPVRTFPASRAAEAFQYMAQAKHIGKLAIAMKDPEARIVPSSAEPVSIRGDRTYLVTGGLGGLGLSLARWLVDRGARHVALVGRRNPGREAQEAIAAMETTGAKILVASADVSRSEEAERVFGLLDAQMPKLAGIVHAAAILEDRTLLEQTEQSFRNVFAPKALGAWNLHALSEGRDLDFFILYSSVAALLGSPGQSNYTASNAMLDALSHERQRRGLCGMSIQWGPFSEVGLAATDDSRGKRLESRGMASLTPREGLLALERLLAHPRANVSVVRFDARRWVEFYPDAARSSYLGALLAAGPRDESARSNRSHDLRAAIAGANHDEGLALLEGFLAREMGHVLRIDSSKIERNASFHHLGLDSLMKLELRNRIRMGLDFEPSIVALSRYDDVGSLAAYLLQQVSLARLLEGAQAKASNADAEEELETITF
ncbi:SDR family NAD(P)-dependent oxidoreductase [Polyangium mundeleinium]|nr:SDR family NAD(P)-dependent oxidoreductase [Polyangium mundeleinium]